MRFKTMSWRPLAVLALGVAVATPFAVALPGEAAAEIKICVIDDHSGDFALPNIPKTHGAQLAVDELNAGGGVNGEQIELIHYDGQSDVKRYQELANKCILDDEVDVIMAGYTSSEREAARAVAVKNKTIFWHNNQGEGGIADKYSFFTGPIPEQQILTGVEYMINTYGPKMYVLAADYGFGQVSALWTHVAAGLFGGEIVGEEFIPLGNSEFAASIANVQKAKPDFMVHYLVGANQSQFYPQAQAVNLGLPAISTVNLQQGYEHRQFSPPSLANMYIPVAYIEEIPTDANKAFIEAWRAKWPDEPYINQPARCAYVAVHIMAEAWRRAGTTDTDAVISALESGITFDAPEGRVLLDPATHHLTMNIRMAHVDETHAVSWVHDFGPVEPWWLRTLGVNLVRQNDGRQYLPWDDARYEKYKKE
ncbi:MAG: ABC transporter substrate-binding protein [Rhodospirillaceae bacterium]|nr:ABC transporter substrate-binding protein [Rhodospirillaceae bacterium]